MISISHMPLDYFSILQALYSPSNPAVTPWDDLADPAFVGVGLAFYMSRVNALLS